MSDVLVVYVSRTGTTEAAARTLADDLGADVDAISPKRDYKGQAGFLRAVVEATTRRRPAIGPTRDPSAYRLVVVCSPVWAGCLASPMRTYLARTHGRLTDVAALCTSGSGLATGVFRQVEELVGHALRGTLSLTQEGVQEGDAAYRIDVWARHLRSVASPGAEAA